MLKGLNEELDSSNDLQGTGISKGFLGRFYPPTIIATEQERTNVAFGNLTTPDEVKSVVLPENGLIVIGYQAKFKSSGSGTGSAAIFLGANQLKVQTVTAPKVQEAKTVGTAEFFLVATSNGGGLETATGNPGADVTTGQLLGSGNTIAGLSYVFAAAGTYNISVQFKATSGSVTAKERKLWVGVIGGV